MGAGHCGPRRDALQRDSFVLPNEDKPNVVDMLSEMLGARPPNLIIQRNLDRRQERERERERERSGGQLSLFVTRGVASALPVARL